jgi:membrane-bound metal-dependent hydrolase YbcI (DUF457 family)
MDTITHGIAGALIGKAFFTGRGTVSSEDAGSVATLAVTLGSVFPDIDVLAELLSSNDLAILQVHRSVTHSLLCLPIFAVVLAAATRWYARRHTRESPSWVTLTCLCAVGLASHILLDLVTSFGTMIWSPWNHTRVAWDLVFIVDFSLTAMVLLPQAVAWVYRQREHSFWRASRVWAFFLAGAVFVFWLAEAVGFPFSRQTLIAVLLALLALFFLPMWRGWGFRVPRSSWCRAGVYALLAYLGICAVAHHAALKRVEDFARSRNLPVERLGALPLPPSVAHWDGLIRTPEGTWEGRMDLWNHGPQGDAPALHFVRDNVPSRYLETAEQLPKVKIYLWFARFPVFRFAERSGLPALEISDLRFFARGNRPAPFTFAVTFDARGRATSEGWVRAAP